MTSCSCARCGRDLESSSKVCQSCGAVVRPAAPAGSTSQRTADTDATVDVRVIRAVADRMTSEAGVGSIRSDATHRESAPVGQARVPGEAGWTNELAPSAGTGVGHEPSEPAPADVASPRRVTTSVPAGCSVPFRPTTVTLRNIDRSWSARWRRGVMLARISYDLLRAHSGMLWVPVIAASAVFVVFLAESLVSLVLPSVFSVFLLLAALAAAASIAMLSQAVIVHRVGMVADGGDESNGQALAAVLPKWRVLAGWGCLSFSVGVVIRWLERGRGPLGWVLRILAVAINVAWSAATFFVVPVILYEDLAARPAIARSRQLLRASWGEGVIGVSIMAVFFNVLGLGAVVLVLLLSYAHLLLLAFLVAIVAVVGINLLSCVATPIFTLVLYRFAVDGSTHFGIEPAVLAAAFRPRRRRRAGAASAA